MPYLRPSEQAILEALAVEPNLDAFAQLGAEMVLDGSRPPWSFYDPSLWTFAVDGGGNVFALHYYPPVFEATRRVPVVFWDHELQSHAFQAETLAAFVSGLAHEVCASIHNNTDAEDSHRPARELLERLGLEMRAAGPGHLREVGESSRDWPIPDAPDLPTVELAPAEQRERALVAQLLGAGTPDEVAEALLALDAQYEELGWIHHLHVLRHQRVDWFENERRRAARS
jgi:hypothetical protein